MPGQTATRIATSGDRGRRPSTRSKPGPTACATRAFCAVTAGPSLADLFAANRSLILRYLMAQGAGEDAEDLLQDLWLRIQRTPAEVEPTRAYLMKMARNLLLDGARAARRQRQRDGAWQIDVRGVSDIDHSPDAEQVVISRDSLQRIDAVLRGLGTRTEAILRRHRIDGVAQRQLAAEEEISLSAVEKHLQKAYRAIALWQLELEGDGGAADDR